MKSIALALLFASNVIAGDPASDPCAEYVCMGDCAPYPPDNVINVVDLLAVLQYYGTWCATEHCCIDFRPHGGDGYIGAPEVEWIIQNWGECAPAVK